MIEYVIGIIYDTEKSQTLLIRKNRPEWQLGMLNGVGGHIEPSETPYEAMVRECKEECNLTLYNWLSLGTITDNIEYKVHYFLSEVKDFTKAKPLTDEVIEILFLDVIDYTQIVAPTDVFMRIGLKPVFEPLIMERR